METLQSILSSLIPKRNLTAPQRSTPSALLNERPVMCSTCQDAELLSVKIDGLWYAEPCPDCAQRRMADRMQAFSNMTTDERRASLNDIIVEQGTDTARINQAGRVCPLLHNDVIQTGAALVGRHVAKRLHPFSHAPLRAVRAGFGKP